MALVLTGNLSLDDDLAGATPTDVSDEVIQFKITAKVDTVEVPATMTTPIHGRGGGADFEIQIGYLSNDIAGTLFQMLWTAITTGAGKLYFEGNLHDGATSVTNPQWSGIFVVTEAEVGAAAEQLSQGSATFPLVAAPAMATS